MEKYVLRKWNAQDIQALADGANNPKIAANMRNSFPSPYTLENAKWYVEDCIKTEENSRIVRIYAEPFDCNVASKSVLKKAGFTYEGTMRNGIYKNGKIQSYCVYSIFKEEIFP